MVAKKSRKAAQSQSNNGPTAAERRNRRLVAGLFVLTFVCLIGWQADQWLDVHVKKVQIEGELSAGERDAVMTTIGDAIEASGAAGLHSLSLAEVQSAVSSLSWAERVSARRRWPDTLVVQLMRHTVVARWGGGGFVASNGQVITGPESAAHNELPLLNCRESNSTRAMEVFNVLSRTLNPAGLRLVELNESLLGEWSAGIAGLSGSDDAKKMLVVLGRDDLAPRLQRFLAVRSQLLANASSDQQQTGLNQIASVDARYHNGVAVQFTKATSNAATQELLR